MIVLKVLGWTLVVLALVVAAVYKLIQVVVQGFNSCGSIDDSDEEEFHRLLETEEA